jgi:peptidoglycan/LPS O-acetylase OafA/YrhL
MFSTTRLSEQMEGRKNNLDAIRLIAALLVIVDHSYVIEGKVPFVDRHLGFSLGTVAVGTFFFISGILITQSWLHDPNSYRYIARRVLRVYPAYLVCILICTFVVGLLFTTIKIQDYLTDKMTWIYLLRNLSLTSLTYDLPGVFADNPYPQTVNGSIWTLPLEIAGYVFILLLGMTQLIKRREVLLVLCLTVFTLYIFHGLQGAPADSLLSKLSIPQVAPIAFGFLSGATVTLYRDKIKLNYVFALCALVFLVATFKSNFSMLGLYVGWMYFILVIGFKHWKVAEFLTIPGDLSYGIYIYAFPVQQILAQLLNLGSPMLNALISTVIVYPIAFISWRFVEKPSLKLKPKAVKPRVELSGSSSDS